ncbi:TIGR03943 family putative permease subunit [Niallia endozanthoxylica]|uniref:TIGR03943 family protein n=1 Tax=Niallia endozanthoxylica TaxID=2036016 RepID=A0A5J5I2U9_9BACI|nr:TIGR03943 family protein [Niallia endozanthoxylica]KAA9030622.1 TIGR03943 family protein [Niallia endozanthoxylica]
MQLQFQQAVRAFILLAFSTMLFKLHYTGDIYKLINPKYENLSQIASIIFLILFFIQITRVWTARKSHSHHCHEDQSCHHDHGDSPFHSKKLFSYAILLFPLATGLLLSPKVLDASIADKKGAMLMLSNQEQVSQGDNNRLDSESSVQEEKNEKYQEEISSFHQPVDSSNGENQLEISEEEYNKLINQLIQNDTIEMNDSLYAAYYDEIGMNISNLKGKTIKLKGFIYKDKDLSQNQLVISRFLITHCIADASIIGFLSEFTEAPSLNQDTWVEAEGILDITTYNGTELPLIKITDWKKVNEPKTPYVYPISIKIM